MFSASFYSVVIVQTGKRPKQLIAPLPRTACKFILRILRQMVRLAHMSFRAAVRFEPVAWISPDKADRVGYIGKGKRFCRNRWGPPVTLYDLGQINYVGLICVAETAPSLFFQPALSLTCTPKRIVPRFMVGAGLAY